MSVVAVVWLAALAFVFGFAMGFILGDAHGYRDGLKEKKGFGWSV